MPPNVAALFSFWEKKRFRANATYRVSYYSVEGKFPSAQLPGIRSFERAKIFENTGQLWKMGKKSEEQILLMKRRIKNLLKSLKKLILNTFIMSCPSDIS